MQIELSLSELRVLRLLAHKQRPLGYWQLAAYLELHKPLSQHLLHVLEHLAGFKLISFGPQPGYRAGAYVIKQAGYDHLKQEYGDTFEELRLLERGTSPGSGL